MIDRVSTLFRGHPNLIMGFNTFLPPGYRIEPTNNPLDPVRVTTPRDQPPYLYSSAIYEGAPAELPRTISPAPLAPVMVPKAPTPIAAPTIAPVPAAAPPTVPVVTPAPAPVPAVTSITAEPAKRAPVEFNHAITYVNKIKVNWP